MISPAAMETSGGGRDGDRRRFLLAQLQAIEGRVTSAPAQQLVVATRFDDCSVLDDEDAGGVHHGMQPIGDHDALAALAKMFDRALNLTLRFGTEPAGCPGEQNGGSLT